jgi:hypothetical protein
MARHQFGDGRYRYFDHPLPDAIAELRTSFYRHLAPIANDWAKLLRGDSRSPEAPEPPRRDLPTTPGESGLCQRGVTIDGSLTTDVRGVELSQRRDVVPSRDGARRGGTDSPGGPARVASPCVNRMAGVDSNHRATDYEIDPSDAWL